MFVVQTINLHSCTAQSLMVISAISTTIMCVVESPMVFRELQPQSVQHFTKLKQLSPLVVETRQRLIPLTEWNGFYFRFSHECFFAVYHIYPYLIYAHALSAARWLQCGVFLFFLSMCWQVLFWPWAAFFDGLVQWQLCTREHPRRAWAFCSLWHSGVVTFWLETMAKLHGCMNDVCITLYNIVQLYT